MGQDTRLVLAVLLVLASCHFSDGIKPEYVEPNPQTLPVGDSRAKGLLYCACSAGSRGYSQAVFEFIAKTKVAIRAVYQTARRNGESAEKTASLVSDTSKLLLGTCFRNYGVEACVNADTATRAPVVGAPAAFPICFYDTRTGKNMAKFTVKATGLPILASLKRCSRIPGFVSQPGALSCPDCGAPSGAPSTPTPTQTAPSTNPPTTQPSASASPTTAPSQDSRGGGTNGPTSQPTATSTLPGQPPPGGIQSATPRIRIGSEGCVAVEHLKGMVVQHKSALRRRVLCAKGFCATPNHGIIVKGKLTSMKQLCSSGRWTCQAEVKLVNNLKISANTRCAFNDEIVITPYDVRFPVVLIWAVQMMEDVIELVCTAVGLAGVVVLSAYAFVKLGVLRDEKGPHLPAGRVGSSVASAKVYSDEVQPLRKVVKRACAPWRVQEGPGREILQAA